MKNIEELKAILHSIGLDQHFDKLAPLVRNSIRLRQSVVNEEEIKIGQTKIGGRPDLPNNISWPMDAGWVEIPKKKFSLANIFGLKKPTTPPKPLSFIAQINLSEVSPFDLDNLLPKQGILYFFYSADQEVWGFDPKDGDMFKVFYFNGSLNELVRNEFPKDLPEHGRFSAVQVEMFSEINLPSYDHEIYKEFNEKEQDKLWKNINPDVTTNKLLGYSDNIQGEMELECELVTNGLYCGDASGYTNPKAKELEENTKNWLLLLQIDTIDEIDMMWGDSGRLYFWIRRDDLSNKNFDRSWFCLQCY